MYRNDKSYLLFVLPSVILFTCIVIIPFLMGFQISFSNWDGISKTFDFVGFDNFIQLFKARSILQPMKNTLFFALGYTIMNNLTAVFLAVLLDRFIRGKKVLKTLFFLPLALSPVLTAFIWGFIYKDVLSSLFGINSLLGNPKTVILGVILMAVWNTVGSNLVIYMAGLTNIPVAFLEAANIDGASFWQQFRYIIIPMLAPAFTVCITLTFTSSLREFATIMSATGGGPAGYSETISMYILHNLFSFQKAGYGQAVSFIFMIVLVVVGASLAFFFRKREVEY